MQAFLEKKSKKSAVFSLHKAKTSAKTASKAHSRPSHGWCKATTARSVHRCRRHRLSALTACLPTRLLVAKEVELVDEVYHEVAVHRIVPRIAAHGGVDDTAHVALLPEDIEELRSEKAMILSRFDKTDDDGCNADKPICGSADCKHDDISSWAL